MAGVKMRKLMLDAGSGMQDPGCWIKGTAAGQAALQNQAKSESIKPNQTIVMSDEGRVPSDDRPTPKASARQGKDEKVKVTSRCGTTAVKPSQG